MTETQQTLFNLLKKYGPQSHYSLYHLAKAKGHKFAPSSVRSRTAELVRMGEVKEVGTFEKTPSGRNARLWGVPLPKKR